MKRPIIVAAAMLFAGTAMAQPKYWICKNDDGVDSRVAEKDMKGYCEPEAAAQGAAIARASIKKSKAEIKGDAERIRQSLAKGEESILNILKDPYSAKFRNTRIGADDAYICGEINSKNSMGGYVGYKRFFTHLPTGQGAIDGSEEFSLYVYGQKCKE